MYATNPEWGPASHNPENPHSFEATQVALDIRAEHGPFITGDTTLYGWLAPRLYRFGLERPARAVVADFLGGPVTPDALLADLRRMRD